MKKLAKYLLLSVLGLLLAAWLLLSVFDANQLKKPVLGWLNQHTELDLTIGHLAFNPLHPYTLLAEEVSLGDWFYARQVYVQLAKLSPLSGQTRIATLDLIDARVQLDQATEQALPDNLANIHIDELTSKNLSLDWQGWAAKGVDLTLRDWQPRQDGAWQWDADATLSGQARQLTHPSVAMAQLSFHGQVRQQQVQLDAVQARLFDGLFESSLTLDWPARVLTLNSPQFSHNRVQLETMPTLAHGWTLALNRARLNKISITSPLLTSNHIDGEIRYFEWQGGSLPDAKGQWQAEEAVLDWLRLDKHQGELLSSKNQLNLTLNGQAYHGSLASELSWYPAQERLDIKDLQLTNNKFVWQSDFAWPLAEVRLHQLGIRRGELLSLDAALPLSILGGELFATDIAWSAGQWRPLSEQARLAASWDEVAFNSLISRQGQAKARLDDTQVWLSQFSSQALDGQLALTGRLGLYPPYAGEWQLTGQNLALQPLSHWLKGERQFSGSFAIHAKLKGAWQEKQSWQGQVAISGQDVFIEKLGLDNWLSHRLSEDYARAKTVDPKLAALDLMQGDGFIYQLELKGPVNQGRWQLDGSALQSVRYLLAVRGNVSLAGNWQLEMGAINDQGCRELAVTLTDSWHAPTLRLHQPRLATPCVPWYQGAVAYPKGGLAGPLREGVRALSRDGER